MNANDLAFPFVERSTDQQESINLGLTKRELFAAMAMQGLCANPYWTKSTHANIAQGAALYADALLSELEKTTP